MADELTGGPPWCPACLWGLDAWDPAALPARGFARVGRWGYRRGWQVDAEVRAALLRDPDSATAVTPHAALVAISAVVITVAMATLLVIPLVWRSELLPPVKLVATLGLLVVVAWAWPQLGRLPKGPQRLRDGEAVGLRTIVAQVAAAVGTEPPDEILIDVTCVNLSVDRVGLRQRSVLRIGMPLWLSLTPQMRVAMLAHALGHLVNDHPTRGLLTRPALDLFRRAVDWTGGERPFDRLERRFDDVEPMPFFTQVVYVVLAVLGSIAAAAQLAIDSLAMPESRRAELAADLVARRVAGSAAFLGALDRVLMLDELWSALVYDVERLTPDRWESESLAVHERRLRPQLELLRQGSIRATDLWSRHPAVGQRAWLVEALPEQPAQVVIEPRLWAAADAELANLAKAVHRTVLDTREFTG